VSVGKNVRKTLVKYPENFLKRQAARIDIFTGKAVKKYSGKRDGFPFDHSGCGLQCMRRLVPADGIFWWQRVRGCMVLPASGEDVKSGCSFHEHIPWTAIIPWIVRGAVMVGSVPFGTGLQQYCPALRIPLDVWPGT